MSGPTPDPTPRNAKRDNKGEQQADPLNHMLKRLFGDSPLDEAALKGTPFDISEEVRVPIEWRFMLSGLGSGGPIYSDHSLRRILDTDTDAPESARADQRTAPPIDFKLARRYARGKLSDDDADRVEALCNRYLSWETAVSAATMEREFKTRKVAPVDFEQIRKYVRVELPLAETRSVRMACEKYESWKLAVSAAAVELACLGDQGRS